MNTNKFSLLLCLICLLPAACSHAPQIGKSISSPYQASFQRFPIQGLSEIGKSPAGQSIPLGGFSGLIFLGRNEANGRLQFLTHTDRGPNTEPLPGPAAIRPRPFLLPAYNPHWITLELDPSAGLAKVIAQKALRRKTGKLLSGLPNRPGDEEPVNPLGKRLAFDPFGADIEGATLLPSGEIWMVEEYRPSFLVFTRDGILRDRLIPMQTNSRKNEFGSEALPANLSKRQLNRGLEGVAYQNGYVYGFMQSPLEKGSLSVPVIAIDTKTRTTAAEYIYPIESTKSDKIGDVASVGDSEFLVIERDGDIGANTKKFLFFAVLDGAGKPMKKKLILDLTQFGFHDMEKAEGLTVVDEYTLALVNDNDFTLAGPLDPKTGQVKIKTEPSYLILINIPQGIHSFKP